MQKDYCNNSFWPAFQAYFCNYHNFLIIWLSFVQAIYEIWTIISSSKNHTYFVIHFLQQRVNWFLLIHFRTDLEFKYSTYWFSLILCKFNGFYKFKEILKTFIILIIFSTKLMKFSFSKCYLKSCSSRLLLPLLWSIFVFWLVLSQQFLVFDMHKPIKHQSLWIQQL